MKKTYINPTITVVKIKTVGMLATSTSMEITEETTSTFDARNFDFDDDEY